MKTKEEILKMSKKECRHRWRVGGFIAGLKGWRIIKIGINIWCEKCSKKLKAYYRSEERIKFRRKR